MKGKLAFENFKPMPITDPLYVNPPVIYRESEIMYIAYETDYESAAQFVPAEMEFIGERPIVIIMMNNYHFTNIGSYLEAVRGFAVMYEGQPHMYVSNIFLDSEVPLAIGREVWGYNKKLAKMGYEHEQNQIVSWADRPTGNRIITAQFTPQINLKAEEWQNNPVLSLKLIPSAEEGKGPEVCQLIQTPFNLTPIVGSDGRAEFWRGQGSVTFNNQSNEDPWYKTPVLNVVDALYGHFTAILPYGRIVHDYLI